MFKDSSLEEKVAAGALDTPAVLSPPSHLSSEDKQTLLLVMSKLKVNESDGKTR